MAGFKFGHIIEIDPELGSLAFAATIIFLLLFEFLIGALEYSFEGRPIHTKMLQKIYKELMIMGFVSFAITMYTAAKDHSPEVYHVIEIFDFVHYVIFFICIFFVAHSLYIMLQSLLASKQYEKLHSLSLTNLIQDLVITESNNFKSFMYTYLPMSSLRNAIEFKIIYALFRDTYSLPASFDYGYYLSGCFERYSLKVMNMSIWSWGILLILDAANYLKVKYGSGNLSCHDHHHDHHLNSDDRHLSSEGSSHSSSKECYKSAIAYFGICAAFLCVYIFILLVVARIYEKRLMAKAGVLTLSDYEDFILFQESVELEADVKRTMSNSHQDSEKDKTQSAANRNRRMSIATFKKKVGNLVKEKHNEEDDEHEIYRHIGLKFQGRLRSSMLLNTTEKFTNGIKQFVTQKVFGYAAAPSGPSRGYIFNQDDIEEQDQPLEEGLKKKPATIGRESASVHPDEIHRRGGFDISTKESKEFDSTTQRLSSTAKLVINHLYPQKSLTLIEQFKLKKLAEGDSRIASTQLIKKKSLSRKFSSDKLKLSEDFSDIYFFHSPQLYIIAMEVGIALNSLYLAMWATNFITILRKEYATADILSQLLMLLPLLIVLPCIGSIVKVSSMLSAIATLNVDVIGLVLEDMEDKRSLIYELQEKVKSRIKGEQATRQEIIEYLFREIDEDNNGFVTKREFRRMLRALNLHYSDDKFSRLFNAADRDKDGVITMQELNHVIFPIDAEHEQIQIRAELFNKQLDALTNNMQESKSHKQQFIKSLTASSEFIEHNSNDAEDPNPNKNVKATNRFRMSLAEGNSKRTFSIQQSFLTMLTPSKLPKLTATSTDPSSLRSPPLETSHSTSDEFKKDSITKLSGSNSNSDPNLDPQLISDLSETIESRARLNSSTQKQATSISSNKSAEENNPSNRIRSTSGHQNFDGISRDCDNSKKASEKDHFEHVPVDTTHNDIVEFVSDNDSISEIPTAERSALPSHPNATRYLSPIQSQSWNMQEL